VKKAVGAGILAVGLAFVLSGCFVMRTLTYTKDTVQAGEKTTAKISVIGTGSDMLAARGVGDEHPFFFLASQAGSVLTNGGTFDTKGRFDGPVALKKDNVLRDNATEACESTTPAAARRGPPPFIYTAVTTEDPFDATNERKFIDAKVPIRAADANTVDAMAIFMGTWVDDGDGEPEPQEASDDEYGCQPPYVTGIKIKGGGPLRP
jgi:hypothetical protein